MGIKQLLQCSSPSFSAKLKLTEREPHGEPAAPSSCRPRPTLAQTPVAVAWAEAERVVRRLPPPACAQTPRENTRLAPASDIQTAVVAVSRSLPEPELADLMVSGAISGYSGRPSWP